MSVRIASTRPAPAVLAAAVLAGGMALTAAAPALAAEERDGGGYFLYSVDEDGRGRFATLHDTAAEDVRVTVAQVNSEGTSDADWYLHETDVAFSYDEELDHGFVDFAQQRRVLGEDATGQVVFRLYIEGQAGPTAVFGPDADLTDADPGELLAVHGPQDYSIQDRPAVDHVTELARPGERMVSMNGGPEGGAPGGGTVTVVDGPEHGTMVAMPGSEDWQSGMPPVVYPSWVYVADEGFAGKDTVTFELAEGDIVKTLVVTYSIGDPRAADFYAGTDLESRNYDEAAVLAALAAQEEGDDGDHTVPGKVETGDGAAWWLAAVGAAGATALVAGRRRLGLTR